VVDLDLLQHWGSRTGESARIQVWFDSEDPAALARVRAALERVGVEIAGVRRVSEIRHSYDTSVPAWSLQLGVLVAVAGLLLAALVLVLLVASTWRRRSRDLACLRMSGVPGRALGGVAVGEQLPIVLLAVLAGGGCGLLAAAFALPFFVDAATFFVAAALVAAIPGTFRAEHPDGVVIVHPECSHEVVELADKVGSTERILEWVDDAAPGAVVGIGTEIHMVQRMDEEHPDKTVVSLDPLICPCSTMFRVDGPHLAWCLEALAGGEIVNQIVVDEHTAEWARVALQRMLDLPGAPTGGD
jgi:hypothetical protein